MLKINNLQVSYGAIKAVKGIDLEVKEGTIVSILGANGAGKTSTLHAISGLVSKAGGTIQFQGNDITGLPAEKIVPLGIIQCPEGRRVFPQLTVEENLKIGCYSRKDKNFKDDYDRVYNLFPRLKERRKQMAGTLSGGEQQMLAIGRGLMGRPKLFIMDEPSLGLAPIIVKEIFETVQQIKKEGVTVLLVEQNAFQTIKISDYVYVLETGKVTLHGPAEVIRNDENVKKSYLGG
ncbi:MAG: ABC transporter ATP-binding protein [Clostridium sp.]|nr:ABC transporter ATP-binding protein [Clostridium sp.]